MEKLQIKKSLEKTKANLSFAIIFCALSIPTLIKALPQSWALPSVIMCLVTIALLYKRILRLKNKINSI